MNDHRDPRDIADTEDARPPYKLVALLAIVVLLACFFFQNGQQVHVDFLWFDGNWPVWLVVGLSVVIGVVLDRLILWYVHRRRRRARS